MPRSIVDSHVHVWSDSAAFAAPDHPDQSGPGKDANVHAFLGAMQDAQVTAAVLVQYIGYRWDNDYVARAIAERPGTFAGVCRVDPNDPQAPDHLSHWTTERGFQGVRLSLASRESVGWMAGPFIDPLFRRAAALNVPVLLLTDPTRLAEIARVLVRHPDTTFVIDHLADCDADNPDHMALFTSLARHPKVHLKTGHLWARSAQGYPWRDKHSLLQRACDAFGPSRLMWGSDWPFCLGHAIYRQTISYLEQEAGFLSSDDLDWIMGGTARRLWTFAGATDRKAPQGLMADTATAQTAPESRGA